MISATDIRGMYAIIATPATADAYRLDATDTIDVAATEILIENLIRDGSTGDRARHHRRMRDVVGRGLPHVRHLRHRDR